MADDNANFEKRNPGDEENRAIVAYVGNRNEKQTIEDDDFVEEVSEAMVQMAGTKKRTSVKHTASFSSVAGRTRARQYNWIADESSSLKKSSENRSTQNRAGPAESLQKSKRSETHSRHSITKKRKQVNEEKKTATKKKTKIEPNQSNEDREYTQIKNSPNILTEVVTSLTAEQRKWVEDTGFGSLLQFNLKELPHKLCFKILQAFDHSSISLHLRCGDIFIKEEDVVEILGFPMGPKKIIFDKPSNVQDLWRKQFNVKEGHKITATSVSNKIKDSATVDDMFKLNFLVLMSNILIQSLGNPYVNQKFVKFEGNLDRASEYNWCALVLDSLIDTKPIWAENPSKKYYTGPLVFILLLYVDRVIHSTGVSVNRQIPVFKGWSDMLLRERQSKELKEKIFGRGMIISTQKYNPTNQGNDESPNTPRNQSTNRSAETPEMITKENTYETPTMNMKEKVTKIPSSIEQSDSDTDEVIEQNCMRNVERSLKKFLKYKAEFEANMNLALQVVPNNKRLAEIKEIVRRTPVTKFTEQNESERANPPTENEPMETELQTDAEANTGFTQAFNDEDFVKKVVEEVEIEEKMAESKKAKPSMELAIVTATPSFNLLTQTDPENVPEPKEKAKRQIKPTEAMKSPFHIRRMNFSKKPCEDERQVYDWLCRCTKPESYVMFEWEGLLLMPDDMDTMSEGRYVACSVVDVWTHLLNNKESMRSSDSPARLFVNPSTLAYTLHESQGNQAARYRRFKSNFMGILRRYAKINLQNVEMVNFAVLEMDHYYMISYNLKNTSWDVIDNSALQPDFESKYAGRPENLHLHFVTYLREINHHKASEIEKLRPNRLDMKWRTKKNSVDCGIFLMRHLECYMGGGTRNFNTDLTKEGKVQAKQLSRLRSLYTHAILLSEENSQADNVIWTAVRFASEEAERIKQQITTKPSTSKKV